MKQLSIEQAFKVVENPQAIKGDGKKLAALWEVVRPFVVMLKTLLGKKLKPFIAAFIAALDAKVAEEESTEEV